MSGYESDTCGRSYTFRIRYVWTQIFLYPHKEICGYKNLRIRVDGALVGKTTTLHVHHAFLYISSPSLHDYDDVKMSIQIHLLWWTWKNEHKTISLIFFSWFSIQSLRIQLQKKIGNIWRIERDGISVKFEAAQIHFLKWCFRSRRLPWCLSSRFLVQRFLAATLRLAFGWFIYPHPSPLLLFHWYIIVTGTWCHWSGSSWLEGAGLLAMAHNSSLSRDWLFQKKKSLAIRGTHLH